MADPDLIMTEVSFISGCTAKHRLLDTDKENVIRMYSIELGGCPFNGPLSGTKYTTRAASPMQNASTPKSSLPFSKHRSCALLCAVVRRF